VPDWCEIEIDRRFIPGEDAEGCQAQAAEAIREHLGSLDGIESLPPWVTMPTLRPGVPDRLLGQVRETVAAVTGRQPEIRGVPFGTDAGPLSQCGVPCLVLGPGDIAQAHTKDEWIDLDQVRTACDIYFELARRLGA
jgi:acetylornithine deacetylase